MVGCDLVNFLDRAAKGGYSDEPPLYQDPCYCLSTLYKRGGLEGVHGMKFGVICDDGGYGVGTASHSLIFIWACYFFCVVSTRGRS